MPEDSKRPSPPEPDSLKDVPKRRGGAPRERPTPEGDGLDPTRYGDWEKNGRCIDFQCDRP